MIYFTLEEKRATSNSLCLHVSWSYMQSDGNYALLSESKSWSFQESPNVYVGSSQGCTGKCLTTSLGRGWRLICCVCGYLQCYILLPWQISGYSPDITERGLGKRWMHSSTAVIYPFYHSNAVDVHNLKNRDNGQSKEIIRKWCVEYLSLHFKWNLLNCKFTSCNFPGGFPVGSDGKESACSAGDPGSILGSGRSLGGGNGHPRQSSCLENSMDRGAWQATVHGVTKSQTWLRTAIAYIAAM